MSAAVVLGQGLLVILVLGMVGWTVGGMIADWVDTWYPDDEEEL